MNQLNRLRILAIALYGERWQLPVSRDLGVHHRQVVRWVSGQYHPKPGHVEKLAKVAAARVKAINKAVEQVTEELA